MMLFLSSVLYEVTIMLRLPYSLSGVFSFQPLTLLIRVGYPQTYISMESLYNFLNDGEIPFS